MKFTSFVTTAAGIFLSTKNGNGVVASLAVANRHAHVVPMTGALLFPDASYQITVDATKMSDAQGRYYQYSLIGVDYDKRETNDQRIYGSVLVGSSFLRKMQEQAGIALESSSLDTSDDAVHHELEMTHLIKTSSRHTDVKVFSKRSKHGSLPVGFYVMNHNPDAYFEIDDDLCVPMVEGTFVSFDGLRPHRTVVNAGYVDLLGPFDILGGKGVGGDHGGKAGKKTIRK